MTAWRALRSRSSRTPGRAEAHLPFGGNGKSGNGSRQWGMRVLGIRVIADRCCRHTWSARWNLSGKRGSRRAIGNSGGEYLEAVSVRR
jgi:hypothetical protein